MTPMPEKSELVAHKPFLVKWPRIYAGLWFGLFGILGGAVMAAWNFVDWRYHLHYEALAQFGAVGGIGACVAAALLGCPFLKSEGVNCRRDAACCGAFIGAVAVGPMAMALAVCSFWNGIRSGDSVGVIWDGFVGENMLVTVLVWCLLSMMPVCSIAGLLLYNRRETKLGPRGCTIHGYREAP